MVLKLVLFDLWGTLFQHEGPGEDHGRAALRVEMAHDALVESGHVYAHEDIAGAFKQAAEALAAVHADSRDISAEARTVLHIEHLDPALAAKLDDAAWARLHLAILAPALHARPDPMSGGIEVLREVKALGFPVGLVSNAGATPGFVLREIMDGYGLLEHFDVTVFSDEVELSKPSPEIYERALAPFGVAPGEAVFVGDQPVLDVLGPQGAGLWTVQLGELTEPGIVPHARIARLDELVPALRTLGLIVEGASTAV